MTISKSMIVEDVMRHNPFVVDADATVRDVSRSMLERGIGSALVRDGNRIVGILSDRDVLNVMTKKKVFDVDREPVTKIMSNRVHFIGAEADVGKAKQVMEMYGVKKLPVMKDGRIAGIVTLTDIVKEEAEAVETFGDAINKLVRKL